MFQLESRLKTTNTCGLPSEINDEAEKPKHRFYIHHSFKQRTPQTMK